MSIKFVQEFRDPIHGLIRVTDQELKVINTRAFQRLRRIRQLAMADLVYPGAVHTRFEHSLGTLHITQRILTHLKDSCVQIDETQERTVRLAALLHDIGHGPFSHVSEPLLDKYSLTANKSQKVEKLHEKITVDIIDKWPELKSLLSAAQRRDIIRILDDTRQRDVLRDIVSSNLDADKMDYLLRDAHYAGVKYGLFDIDKIIASFVKQDDTLAIDEDGLFAVEQLVVAKYHMTQQVYAHKVRVITDAMIERGLELGIQ